MKWNKYTIKTKAQATDYICGLLVDLGITGMEIEDNVQLTEKERKAQFIDYVPTLPDSDDANVIFYTETEDNENDEYSDTYNMTGIEVVKKEVINDEELLEKLRQEILEAKAFMDVGDGTITKDITSESDFADNWKEFFKSFDIGRFHIKPIWDKEEEIVSDNVIYIDPGMAFGTGKHETTSLCMLELEKYVKPGMRVFDVGTGSAILSIVAKKLGAGEMLLTDIDPEAIRVVPHTFEINGLPNEDKVLKANLLDDKELQKEVSENPFDIVVANILCDVIIPLAKDVHNYMKKDAVFISSGIIYTRADEVVDAINANPELILKDVKRDGDWVMVSAVRK